jgi:hypothetical protein
MHMPFLVVYLTMFIEEVGGHIYVATIAIYLKNSKVNVFPSNPGKSIPQVQV